MAIGGTIYRSIFQRPSTTILAWITGAFLLEHGSSAVSDYVFDSINKGVSLLFTAFLAVIL